MIQTINKKIAITEVKGKFNFAHEHISFDLTHVRNDNSSKNPSYKILVNELLVAKKQGLGLIVDLSNHSMNSDKNMVFQISQELNIPIVTATGYYLAKYEKKNNLRVHEIQKLFLKDIKKGFKNTNFKAGIIGEIGTSDKIYEFEKRVFQAACLVQNATGVPIYTHLNLGANALKQAQMLLDFNAYPAKVIIGHADFLSYENEVQKILKMGFNIGIDTIGKLNYLSDQKRASLLKKIIRDKWEDRLVLSLDISNTKYLKKYGGHGYGYLHNQFLKVIHKNLTQKQIHKVFFSNILRILDFGE